MGGHPLIVSTLSPGNAGMQTSQAITWEMVGPGMASSGAFSTNDGMQSNVSLRARLCTLLKFSSGRRSPLPYLAPSTLLRPDAPSSRPCCQPSKLFPAPSKHPSCGAAMAASVKNLEQAPACAGVCRTQNSALPIMQDGKLPKP
jgi:hypothetical protein